MALCHLSCIYMQALIQVSRFLGYTTMCGFLDDHFLSMLAEWLDKEQSLDSFPHQLFGDSSQAEFFRCVFYLTIDAGIYFRGPGDICPLVKSEPLKFAMTPFSSFVLGIHYGSDVLRIHYGVIYLTCCESTMVVIYWYRDRADVIAPLLVYRCDEASLLTLSSLLPSSSSSSPNSLPSLLSESLPSSMALILPSFAQRDSHDSESTSEQRITKAHASHDLLTKHLSEEVSSHVIAMWLSPDVLCD